MKIEWASDFHRDGSRRSRPVPSTMHGWLAKMRGTLIGDEKLRSRGIREMKEAKVVRQYNKNRKAQAKPSKGFSLFGSGGEKSKPPRPGGGAGARGRPRPGLRHHSSSHRLVGQSSRRSSGTQSRGSTGARRGVGQRRGTTRRPSGR